MMLYSFLVSTKFSFYILDEVLSHDHEVHDKVLLESNVQSLESKLCGL